MGDDAHAPYEPNSRTAAAVPVSHTPSPAIPASFKCIKTNKRGATDRRLLDVTLDQIYDVFELDVGPSRRDSVKFHRAWSRNQPHDKGLILSIDMEELDPLAGLGDLEFEVAL